MHLDPVSVSWLSWSTSTSVRHPHVVTRVARHEHANVMHLTADYWHAVSCALQTTFAEGECQARVRFAIRLVCDVCLRIEVFWGARVGMLDFWIRLMLAVVSVMDMPDDSAGRYLHDICI